MNGDYNIDLLQLHTNNHYNSFYENVTSQGFFPKISRPTRSFENSHSLIDNIFSNNLCKSHTSGILTHHISDYLMNFCIVESKTKKKPIPNKYIEVENVNPKSIANLKKTKQKNLGTINKTLNKNRKSNDFPLEFKVNNYEPITDTKDIANDFNIFFLILKQIYLL